LQAKLLQRSSKPRTTTPWKYYPDLERGVLVTAIPFFGMEAKRAG